MLSLHDALPISWRQSSVMHLFLIPAHWPAAADLAADLGCRAVLLAEDSGGSSFDEAFSTPWPRLAARFPDYPIPPACLSATVALPGRPPVTHPTPPDDAPALFHTLPHPKRARKGQR